jgi:hypothetical protein
MAQSKVTSYPLKFVNEEHEYSLLNFPDFN